MPIRAVLFDLDNTLLLEDDATEEALRQTSDLAARRAHVDARPIRDAARNAAETLFRSSEAFPYADAMGIWWGEALWGDFAGDQDGAAGSVTGPGGSLSGLAALRAFGPGFRRAVWHRALAAAAISDDALVGELAAAYPAFRRALRPIDPAAEAVLEDLGRDHRLALVTNGAPDVQREKLAPTTLARHFTAIVISAEIGIGKPDPGIFRAALEALDVASPDAVMVGDSLERDVAGARRAGVRSVWLDRTGGSGATGPIVPDARIRSLGELRASLAGIERMRALSRSA
jgi:putative hydrolase of the HAD superfamily